MKKTAEKRQALAEALRKDILENGGQTVKDQPCAMLMFDYTGIPSEGYMDEWGMNVPAVQEGENVSTSVLVYPSYKRTLAILEETGYPLSMDELSVEYIDVYYFSSEAAGEDDEGFSDTEPISDLEKQRTVIKSVTIKRNSWKLWKKMYPSITAGKRMDYLECRCHNGSGSGRTGEHRRGFRTLYDIYRRDPGFHQSRCKGSPCNRMGGK